MKLIPVSLVTTLVSISSFACPNIQGLWSCSGTAIPQKIEVVKTDDSYYLEILEDLENDFPKTTFVLDGKPHRVSEGQYTAVCESENSSILIDGSQYLDREKKDLYTVTFRYTLVKPDMLYMNVVASSERVFSKPHVEPTVCKRTVPLN